MVMLISTEVVPPELVPVIVKLLRASRVVGVPLISPVALSKVKPAGIEGLMVQETISPGPVTLGVSGKSLLIVLLTRFKSSTE